LLTGHNTGCAAVPHSNNPFLREHRFPDIRGLAIALSGDIKVDLEESIAVRSAASLVVSGGRTPAPVFDQLQQESLDWRRVTVTLADERWVATTDGASNERLVRTHLLRGKAANAHFLGL
jgi:6-phosphogluconolactonase